MPQELYLVDFVSCILLRHISVVTKHHYTILWSVHIFLLQDYADELMLVLVSATDAVRRIQNFYVVPTANV